MKWTKTPPYVMLSNLPFVWNTLFYNYSLMYKTLYPLCLWECACSSGVYSWQYEKAKGAWTQRNILWSPPLFYHVTKILFFRSIIPCVDLTFRMLFLLTSTSGFTLCPRWTHFYPDWIQFLHSRLAWWQH